MTCCWNEITLHEINKSCFHFFFNFTFSMPVTNHVLTYELNIQKMKLILLFLETFTYFPYFPANTVTKLYTSIKNLFHFACQNYQQRLLKKCIIHICLPKVLDHMFNVSKLVMTLYWNAMLSLFDVKISLCQFGESIYNPLYQMCFKGENQIMFFSFLCYFRPFIPISFWEHIINAKFNKTII